MYFVSVAESLEIMFLNRKALRSIHLKGIGKKLQECSANATAFAQVLQPLYWE